MKRISALLFPALIVLSLTTLPLNAQTAAKPLTVEAIYAHGPLIGNPPDELTWSPDGKHLTYLDDGELVDLRPGTDSGAGKPHVLASREILASLLGAPDTETDRDHRDRYKMASYFWAPDSTHLLFDSDGRLWLYDLAQGKGVEIGVSGMGSGDDPQFSPNGDYVSFVRNHGLAVVRLRQPHMPVVAVAPAPNPTTLNGEVDWVYEEELDVRSNYFWSPDSARLAYLQMDEAAVPQYPITDWIPTHATVDLQRYPQPGDANPTVRVGVVSATGGPTVWVQLPIQAGQDYIPRFGWADANTVWIETLTRDHKHQDIYLADAATGQAHPVLQLTDDKFLDEKYDVFVGDGSIVLTNWADGHMHLYLYSYDPSNPSTTTATLQRQLTKGDFEVGEVRTVDFAAKVVRYESNENNLLEQQLWQVSFQANALS